MEEPTQWKCMDNYILIPQYIPDTSQGVRIKYKFSAQINTVNRMVSTPSNVQESILKVVPSLGRSICHASKPQSVTMYPGPRKAALGNKCSEHTLVWPHSICLPSNCFMLFQTICKTSLRLPYAFISGLKLPTTIKG